MRTAFKKHTSSEREAMSKMKIEEGDGFVLGAPHYLHFFFAEDLLAELEASPFLIVNPVLKKEKFTCILRKQNT